MMVDYKIIVPIVALAVFICWIIYQLVTQRKLSQHLKTDSWKQYELTSQILGSVQTIVGSLQNSNIPAAIDSAGYAHGYAQSMLMSSIENIYRCDPYTCKKVDDWVSAGKLPQEHESTFKRLAKK
jgi:hypothetical protein